MHSLGQLLRGGGYATYYSGKWNIGDGLERSPGARGWDRYLALEQTGADNFEAKVYAPFNLEAVWWEDGRRAERYARQVEMERVPDGLTLPRASPDREWARLSDDERRAETSKMAVFAAMLDNADQQIGRLREHLRSTGELDNTVFIVMSDNGADAYDLSQLNLAMRLWYRTNFALGIERMGGPGSYVHYGQDWAEVSNTPFALFKGTSGEGGMRVPFIVHFPGRVPGADSLSLMP